MQGADEYYNIIDKADRLHIDSLRRINCYGYGYGFQHDNIVFLISEHARGKTFTIWIFESADIKDTLKDDHLEVYGITGGQPGWTETYGWVAHGAWEDVIMSYLDKLKNQIYEIEHKDEIENQKREEARLKAFNAKVERYNKLFSDKGE